MRPIEPAAWAPRRARRRDDTPPPQHHQLGAVRRASADSRWPPSPARRTARRSHNELDDGEVEGLMRGLGALGALKFLDLE